MKKGIVALLAAGILAGPFASAAVADPTVCRIMAKLGYENVRECE
jgi:predicted Kef-type K+ transport protein